MVSVAFRIRIYLGIEAFKIDAFDDLLTLFITQQQTQSYKIRTLFDKKNTLSMAFRLQF